MGKKLTRAAFLGLTLLAGCAGISQPPQPTPASIGANATAIAALSGDPVLLWQAGDDEVRVSCWTWWTNAANQQATAGLASTGVGLSGVAAAGLLVANANPVGAATAGILTSLIQSGFAAYQASGLVPTTADMILADNAMSTIENQVDAMPPATAAEAVGDALQVWSYCSPAGLAMLRAKAQLTATVTPTGPSQSLGLIAPVRHRPGVLVNGH
jgi:hypothetical protein